MKTGFIAMSCTQYPVFRTSHLVECYVITSLRIFQQAVLHFHLSPSPTNIADDAVLKNKGCFKLIFIYSSTGFHLVAASILKCFLERKKKKRKCIVKRLAYSKHDKAENKLETSLRSLAIKGNKISQGLVSTA